MLKSLLYVREATVAAEQNSGTGAVVNAIAHICIQLKSMPHDLRITIYIRGDDYCCMTKLH